MDVDSNLHSITAELSCCIIIQEKKQTKNSKCLCPHECTCQEGTGVKQT